METVKDILEWKNTSGESLEKVFFNETIKLGWDSTDTLYSFLAIYVLGLRSIYPSVFKRTRCQIRTLGGTNAYSNKYISENYMNYKELNNLKSLKAFISSYLTIGNLMPIWPGGNTHKGISQCFDMPEIYFSKHAKWADVLQQVYVNSYIESIVNNKHIEINKLLEMDKQKYSEFLEYVVDTISERTVKLKDALQKIDLN